VTAELCFAACAHLDCCQVVSADGYQSPLAAQVLVQLVLQVNEAVVAGCIKGASPEDGTDDKRAH
jgi:hypothetical protein